MRWRSLWPASPGFTQVQVGRFEWLCSQTLESDSGLGTHGLPRALGSIQNKSSRDKPESPTPSSPSHTIQWTIVGQTQSLEPPGGCLPLSPDRSDLGKGDLQKAVAWSKGPSCLGHTAGGWDPASPGCNAPSMGTPRGAVLTHMSHG